MRRWSSAERAARAVRAVVAAAVLLSGAGAAAHEGEAHGGDAAAGGPVVAAPAFEPLAYTPPAPGTYELPPLGVAGDGRVLLEDGAPARLSSLLRDRLVVLSFIYASCSDAKGCPFATAVLRQVAERIAADVELAREVRLVSLSFDPDRDTPEVMRRYRDAVAPPGADWRFVTTASRAELAPILEAYGQSIVIERDAEGRELGPIAHLLRVMLVDRAGRLRNVYGLSFLHPDTLLNDVRTLRLEAAGGAAKGAPAGAVASAGGAAVVGPGDDRAGYERRDYRTRSTAIRARRGEPADLLGRIARPPLGLPPVPVPADNPISAEKIELGRRLFFDRRLSHNDTFSCAMCHVPEQGFTSNEMATAVGIEGRSVRRNSPTIYNSAYLERLFHDGRETSLEQQIWGPLLAQSEMANPSVGAVLEKLRGLPGYLARFERAFPGRGLSMETLGMAIASYERTLVSGDSPFDRWRYGGDESALDAPARRGFALFAGRAGCASCHTVGEDHALLSDGGFHNTGVGFEASMGRAEEKTRVQVSPGVFLDVERSIIDSVSEPRAADLGRYEITGDPADRWRYRTPTLRNVALTAPYMHDGSLATLEEVVAFYDAGGVANPGRDPRVRPLGLSDGERADLVAFLRALTGSDVGLLVADAFAAPIGDVGAPPPGARPGS